MIRDVPDPDLDFIHLSDPGSRGKKVLDPGSGTPTLNKQNLMQKSTLLTCPPYGKPPRCADSSLKRGHRVSRFLRDGFVDLVRGKSSKIK
jgi:hypothetical protein